jgi:purine nucleosidase
MECPELSATTRVALLEPPTGKVHMVLDTDTYNEIDDQFALVYALLSPEKIDLEAVYAAPFHNTRSTDPENGMLKSYEEILRVLAHLSRPHEGFVFKGSTTWLPGPDQPVRSSAVDDLIARARMDRTAPLYVVAIGAITNIASAILTAPDIIARIVVVWLGGNSIHWPSASEFNLQQDIHASRLIFDCGVPLVHVPCLSVTDRLSTTQAEMERYVKGRSSIGDYLCEIYAAYYEDHFARSKPLWDVGPIAWLVNPSWVDTALIHSPILTSERTWSHDPHRHLIREAWYVHRDAIFGDLFRKLERTS